MSPFYLYELPHFKNSLFNDFIFLLCTCISYSFVYLYVTSPDQELFVGKGHAFPKTEEDWAGLYFTEQSLGGCGQEEDAKMHWVFYTK